jgi:hypothetical protein
MRRTAIIVFALALVLIGGAALASIPDSSGVIHGCYKNNNPAKGSVLVVDSEAGESCPSGFTALNWNQTGPQGPVGATGPQGPAGPALELVQVIGTLEIEAGQIESIQLQCPEGVHPLVGTWLLEGGAIEATVEIVASTYDLGSNRWFFLFKSEAPNTKRVEVRTLCGDFSVTTP